MRQADRQDRYHVVRPLRPPCTSGRCSADDYEIVELRRTDRRGLAQSVCKFECKCGTLYLRDGRRFMVVEADGKLVPYMLRKGPFGPWEKDSTNPMESVQARMEG